MLRTLLTSTAALMIASGTAFAHDWDAWDTDADKFVNEEEFRTGVKERDVFAIYDVDKSGYIDEDEYARAGFNHDAFNDWDDIEADARLDEEEFYAGVFDTYDRDADERWADEDLEDFMSVIRGAGEIDGEPSAN